MWLPELTNSIEFGSHGAKNQTKSGIRTNKQRSFVLLSPKGDRMDTLSMQLCINMMRIAPSEIICHAQVMLLC